MKKIDRFLVLLAIAGLMAATASASDGLLKTRVLQPPYAADAKGEPASSQWLLDELGKCDESLDLIVLPEFSDVPARLGGVEFHVAASNNNARLLAACAETAKRCKSMLFVNALYETPQGWRNTTHAFDRTGTCVGRYFKRHVTAGEHVKLGLDVSYTEKWEEPYVLELEGIRFAFLTCYDFYFYESFANLARYKPNVLVGCSLQRSDPLHVLKFINAFCAYNVGAYLVRSSVSLSPDSPVGGSSMVVSPDGRILENLESRPGTITCTFDPRKKYLKPAGFGNPPATHAAYIEIGRRPWQYRPGGSAIVPFFRDAAPKRLCAHRGLPASIPENTLPGFAAAVALGATEIELDLWWTKDGEIVSIHDPTLKRVSNGTGKVYEKTYAELCELDFGCKAGKGFGGLKIMRFSELLAKLSCHAILNIHMKSLLDTPWDERHLKKVVGLIDAYDARGHVYFMTENEILQDQLARVAPDIPRCMGHDGRQPDRIVERAVAHKCQMVQLFKPYFDQSTVDRAHAAGLRCNVFWSDDPAEARKFLDMGIDTILTNDYLPISAATGLR